jgi:nitric oxide reductase subunit B
MNAPKQIAWQLFFQACLLLLLYAAASLFLGVKFLPTDPLAVTLPFAQVAAVKHMLLDAALLTGLLGTAVYFLLESPSPLLTWLYRAWTIFLLLTALSGLMGFYEGRHMLELPFYLDILQLVLIAAWIFVLALGKADAGKEIFLAALLIISIAYAFSLLPIQSLLYDRILRILMVNARYFVAYPLAAVVIAYWMKPDLQIYYVAAAMTVLGSMVSIAPLTAVSTIPATGIIIAPAIFLFALFVTRMTLSRDNWGNLSLLLMMLSLGVLGTAFAIPALGKHILGTQLSEVQYDLAAWGVIAVLFSLICQLSQDNHQNFRFWLTAGGIIGAALALGIAGVVQSFMERVLSIGYLDTQSTILALYMLWIAGIMLWGFGILLQTWRLLRGNWIVAP